MKQLTRLLLFLVIPALIIFAYFSIRPFFYQKIYSLINEELSKTFKREIKVGGVAGSLFYNVAIENIAIGEEQKLVSAKAIQISFNPFKVIANRGDFTSAITKIKLVDPYVYLERDKDGFWNLQKIFPPSKPGAKPPKFEAKIIIERASIDYLDNFGLLRNQKQPFFTSVEEVNGKINIKKLEKFKLALKGRFKNNPISVFSINGSILPQKKKFNFVVSAQHVLMAGNADYFLPASIINIVSGESNLQLKISDASPDRSGRRLPLNINGLIAVKEAVFKSSFLKTPVTNINGSINLFSDKIYFPLIKGKIFESPIQLSGKIEDFSNLNSSLQVDLSHLNLSKLHLLAPVFRNLNLQGLGELKIIISEKIKNPKITVDGEFSKVNIYGFRAHLILAQAIYENKLLKFEITKALIGRGTVKGRGEIDFGQRPALCNADISLSEIHSSSILKSKDISGIISGGLSIFGPFNDLTFMIDIKSSDFSVFGQKINSSTALFQYKEGALLLKNLFAQSGASILNGSGSFDRSKTFSLKTKLQNINLKKDSFSGIFSGDAELYGKFDKNIYKSPLEFISGKTSLNIQNVKIFDENINEVKLTLTSLGKGSADVKAQINTSGQGLVSLFGQIGQRGFATGIFVEGEKISLENIPTLQKYIPQQLFPLRGISRFNFYITDKDSRFISPHVKGSFILDKAIAAGQKIDEIKTDFDFELGKLNLKKGLIKTGFSWLSFDGFLKKNEISLNISSDIYLSDFLGLLRPFGAIDGYCKFTGLVIKKQNKWNLTNASFFAQDISYNQIKISLIDAGQVSFLNETLIIPSNKAFKLTTLGNTYTASGQIQVSQQPFILKEANFNISTENSDLRSAIIFVNQIFREIKLRNKKLLPGYVPKSIFLKDNIFLPVHQDKNPFQQLLFQRGEHFVSPFNYLLGLKEDKPIDGKDEIPVLLDECQGIIPSASFAINFKKGREFIINGNVLFTNGKLGIFSFREMAVSIDAPSSLVSVSAEISNGAFGNSAFDNLSADFSYEEGWITFHQFDFEKDDQVHPGILEGKIPVGAFWNKSQINSPINLNIRLEKDVISLLSFLNPAIEEIRNNGEIIIDIGGTFKKPKITFKKLTLDDAAVKLIYFPSWIKTKESKIYFEQNTFKIEKLKFSWQGPETVSAENEMILQGMINFNNLDFSEFSALEIIFDLKVENGQFKVDLTKTALKEIMPIVYQGRFYFNNLSFQGQTRLFTKTEPFPKLSGNVSFREGHFYLTQVGGPKKENKFPIELDLSIFIEENVVAEGSNLLLGDLGGIVGRMNLEFVSHSEPIKVYGTTKSIQLLGRMEIENGYLRILNKTFDLLPKEAQRDFFSQELERISPNYLEFGGKILDTYLHLVAQTDIQELQTNSNVSSLVSEVSSEEEVYLKRKFLVILDGVVNNMSTIVFEKYDIESSTPAKINVYKLAKDLQGEEIKEIINALIPDLHKGASGVLTQLTQQQIDTLVYSAVRPLEREAAKALGLEDLRLDYSLGEKLIASEEVAATSKVFGFEFAKKIFSERLKIKLKTNVEEASIGSSYILKITSYKLIYSLTDYLSLNFENTKVEEQDPLKGLFSLEASVKF